MSMQKIAASGQWIAPGLIAQAQTYFDSEGDQKWHMYYTFNGHEWFIHPAPFATQALAQAQLDTFCGGIP